mgnify:FL=1
MSGLRRRECRRCAATLSFTASLRLTKAGTDAIAAGEASLLFYAVSAKDTNAHFEKPAGSLSLTRGIEAGPIEIDAHAQSRQRILADPALLEMEWNGSGAIGILPSALDAKTLPSNDEPINATIQEESADKEAGAGDTPSPTNSAPASFEAPNEPAADPNDPELADSLGLADPQEIDEGNCCVLAALDHTEVIDAANIEVAAANQPSASRLSSHFPNPSKSSFCHRARSWPQHCSPCWAPRILETKLKRSRLSTLQPPPSCVYTPLLQTEARPWNSMVTHS